MDNILRTLLTGDSSDLVASFDQALNQLGALEDGAQQANQQFGKFGTTRFPNADGLAKSLIAVPPAANASAAALAGLANTAQPATVAARAFNLLLAPLRLVGGIASASGRLAATAFNGLAIVVGRTANALRVFSAFLAVPSSLLAIPLRLAQGFLAIPAAAGRATAALGGLLSNGFQRLASAGIGPITTGVARFAAFLTGPLTNAASRGFSALASGGRLLAEVNATAGRSISNFANALIPFSDIAERARARLGRLNTTARETTAAFNARGSSGFLGLRQIPQNANNAALGINTVARSSQNLATATPPAANGISGLAKSFLLVAGPVAVAVAAFSTLKDALTIGSQTEQTRVAFETFTGSVETATTLLEGFRRDAAATPFQLKDIEQAGQTLLNFGSGANVIRSELRSLGDLAAGNAEKFKDLALIYGQAQAAGVVYTQDLYQLTTRGIPIFDELAKVTGKQKSEIKKLAEQGLLSFPLLQQAMANLTGEGGRFFNLMEKQSQTTAGLVSTLKDSWDELLRVIGVPLNDSLRPMLKEAVGLAGRFASGFGAAIKLIEGLSFKGDLGESISLAAEIGFKEASNSGLGFLRGLGQGLIAAFSSGVDFFGSVFGETGLLTLNNLGSGLLKTFEGSIKYLQAALGPTFADALSKFQAGLQTTTDGILNTLILLNPDLADAAGLKPYQSSYEENLAEFRKANDPDKIAAEAQKSLAEGQNLLNDALSSLLQKAGESAAGKFSDLDFSAAKIFDTSEAKKKLIELAKSADPKALEDLKAALAGTVAITKENLGALKPPADQLAAALDKIANGADKELAAREENTKAIQEEKDERKKGRIIGYSYTARGSKPFEGIDGAQFRRLDELKEKQKGRLADQFAFGKLDAIAAKQQARDAKVAAAFLPQAAGAIGALKGLPGGQQLAGLLDVAARNAKQKQVALQTRPIENKITDTNQRLAAIENRLNLITAI